MDTATMFLILAVAITVTVLFLPGFGVRARMRKNAERAVRINIEDALKCIYDFEYNERVCRAEDIAASVALSQHQTAELLRRLVDGGLAAVRDGNVSLTRDGREYALRIIRSHRLWERFLADETDMKATRWHHEAEKREHALSHDEVEQLAAQLGHPHFDPHGDPIPTGLGNQPATGAGPVTALSAGMRAKIIHIEDEPEQVYAELIQHGLTPGLTVSVVEQKPDGVVLNIRGSEVILSGSTAKNLTVLPEYEKEHKERTRGKTLADMAIGSTARVRRILPGCRGQQRRRLMDLGVLPGTEVTADMRSPFGDPVSYRIRGASIALRSDQARMIEIESDSKG